MSSSITPKYNHKMIHYNLNNYVQVEDCLENIDRAYQQGKKDAWEDIDKIINGMTNPIQTMKIIIEQMKGEQNE
jgi:hypothetical protein